MSLSAIRYLKRSEINAAKWNHCIDTAANGLIYGYTFYLDAMCSNWDALVLEDYRAVMPLPWRKKWGINYLYQPFAVAQSGLFGNAFTPGLLYGFLKKIPSKFKYWDVSLNFANRFSVPQFPLYERKNYVLHLNQPYEKIRSGYRTHIRKNIKKAVTKNFIVQKDIDSNIVIELAKKHAANKATTNDFRRFKTVYQLLLQKKQAVTYDVISPIGAVLASAAFFLSHRRAYYILPGNHPDGRMVGASHFLIDQFIKDHAGQDLILDFEGSDVPGLQFFYSSFGAIEEPYAAIRYNCLPWFIRWMRGSPLSPGGGN